MQRKPSKNNKKFSNKIEGFGKNKETGPPMYIWIPLVIIAVVLIIWAVRTGSKR